MMDDLWWCFSFSQDRASSENQFVLTALVLVCIMERCYSTRLNCFQKQMSRAILPKPE